MSENSSSAPPPLQMAVDAGVLWLRLDRPHAANALNGALVTALIASLADARADFAVKAVVLAAAGERTFCAGADRIEMTTQRSPQEVRARGERLVQLLNAVGDFQKPLIAAVRAPAVGAGAMMAWMADEIVCAPSASFSLPELALGIPPVLAAATLASRGDPQVRYRLLVANEKIPGAHAIERGLANHLVDSAEVEPLATDRALALGSLPPQAFSTTKAWLNRARRAEIEAAASQLLAR